MEQLQCVQHLLCCGFRAHVSAPLKRMARPTAEGGSTVTLTGGQRCRAGFHGHSKTTSVGCSGCVDFHELVFVMMRSYPLHSMLDKRMRSSSVARAFTSASVSTLPPR